MKALAVGRGWPELLNYFRTGGDLQGGLFCKDPEAQEGTNGRSRGKVGKGGGEVGVQHKGAALGVFFPFFFFFASLNS